MRRRGPREAGSGLGAGARGAGAGRLSHWDSASLAAPPGGLHSGVQNSPSSPAAGRRPGGSQYPGAGHLGAPAPAEPLESHPTKPSLLRNYSACPFPLLRESLAGGKLIFNIVKLIKGLEAGDGVGGRVGA